MLQRRFFGEIYASLQLRLFREYIATDMKKAAKGFEIMSVGDISPKRVVGRVMMGYWGCGFIL